MSYSATVIPIMIASPGDVLTERRIAREVISEWNDVHSLSSNTVLTSVGWDTHSAPDLGDRGQKLINERVLKDCDLLVGIFWTRLGTPTGSSESGSVEEIKTHLASGKPAMIYFSSQPVRLDSVDAAQYEAVKKFQEWCQQSGLYKTYDDPGDFEKTFRKDLQINLYQVPYLTNLLKKAGAFDSDAVYTPNVMIEISIEARELLRTAAADKHGTILKAHYIGGSHIQAHGQVFGQGGDRRAYARWEAALEELEHEGLVAPLGHKREIFAVTDKGYKLGDQLWGGSPSTAQH